MTNLIIKENIESKICHIRRKNVMMDFDLANLYGVETKRINEADRKNKLYVSGTSFKDLYG